MLQFIVILYICSLDDLDGEAICLVANTSNSRRFLLPKFFIRGGKSDSLDS